MMRRLGLIALPLVAALLGACTGSRAAKSPSAAATAQRSATAGVVSASGTAGARPSGTAGSVLPATAAAVTAVPGIVLLQASGDNPSAQSCCTVNLHSSPFNVPGAWDLNWSYDCSRLGHVGYLGVDAYAADGTFISNPPSLNLVGTSGQGVQPYAKAGIFSLVVNSVCRWSLMAISSARPTATPPGALVGTGLSGGGLAAGAPQSDLSAAAAAGSASATPTPAASAGGGGAAVSAPPIATIAVPTPATAVPITIPTPSSIGGAPGASPPTPQSGGPVLPSTNQAPIPTPVIPAPATLAPQPTQIISPPIAAPPAGGGGPGSAPTP